MSAVDPQQSRSVVANFVATRSFPGLAVASAGTGSGSDTATEATAQSISFLDGLSGLRLATDVISPLRVLSSLDYDVAHDFFVAMVPGVWRGLDADMQRSASSGLVQTLVKASAPQRREIATVLEAAHQCEPPIDLPPVIVWYMAKSHGAWFEAAAILERLASQPDDDDDPSLMAVGPVALASDPSAPLKKRAEAVKHLQMLYAHLQEGELARGLVLEHAQEPATHIGIAYAQYGCWREAQSTFFNALDSAYDEVGRGVFSGALKTGVRGPAESELFVWEDEWLDATKHLQQWDLIRDYAFASNHAELILSASWRGSDWRSVREALASDLFVESPDLLICQTYLSLKRAATRRRTTCWRGATCSSTRSGRCCRWRRRRRT